MSLARHLPLPALAVVLLVPATAAAGPVRLTPAEESLETRFVLYALEDLFRSTWPGPASVGHGRSVKTFLAQRERLVDDLSHRVRDAKLGGDQNAALIEAIELSMKAVRGHGQKYVADLDRVIDLDGAMREYAAIYKRVDREADPLRHAVANQVNGAALDYMRRPDANPFGMFASMFLGLMAESRIQLGVQADTWRQFEANHLRQARERYAIHQPPLAQALCSAVRRDLAERSKALRELSATLGAARKWPAAEMPFGDKPEERTTDPFPQMRQIEAEEVPVDRGTTRESADRLARARRYLKLVPLVPRPSDNAFNFYRAVIYFQAGQEANRAAALSVGSTGFSTRKGSEASRLAIQVWQRYVVNSDRDVTPEVLYNYALALVYNGGAIPAYDMLKKASAQFLPRSPDFCYDVARLCSVAAEDTALEFARISRTPQFLRLNAGQRSAREREVNQRINHMLQDSSLMLQWAVCRGFKDVERARESPDLKQLRSADARTLGRRRTFEQIVADQKTLQKVVETTIAGK